MICSPEGMLAPETTKEDGMLGKIYYEEDIRPAQEGIAPLVFNQNHLLEQSLMATTTYKF
jgi:hypothetical protein